MTDFKWTCAGETEKGKQESLCGQIPAGLSAQTRRFDVVRGRVCADDKTSAEAEGERMKAADHRRI